MTEKLTCSYGLGAAASSADTIKPDKALRLLQAGNERFREWRVAHPNETTERQIEIFQGHNPVAQVLSCSDLSSLPETIFDQALGSLLITQVAGNVVDESVKGSVEYGAVHLSVRLIVVLGHRNCATVRAAVCAQEVHGNVGNFLYGIFATAITAKGKTGDSVEDAVRANVIHSVDLLRNSQPTLQSMSQSGQLKIVGAVYDPTNGTVDWLED